MQASLRFSLRLMAVVLCALCLRAANAADSEASTAEKVDYLTQIKPVLAERCYSCHGGLKQEGSLRVDTARLLDKGGDSGPAVVAGKSAESMLIERITAEDADYRMPPEAAPLKPEEILLIKAWIEQGAQGPADEQPEQDPADHWSYQVPVRPALPMIGNHDWTINPIDTFIAKLHAEQGLQPQPEADKRVLLRRVYLDVIGLPPTPAQLQAFLQDDSENAYAKVVDQLLESPQYGERWARHWMDVWRYSDWYGYQAELRNSSRHMWKWRDWIIESLNADKPYDRMVLEMLAGDELAPGDLQVARATGFLARNYYKFNRNTWLDNTVEHTAKAFLGMTLNCARCHDHKYDPVSQQAYYEFRAIFEPHQIRTDRVVGESDTNKDGLSLAYDADANVQTFLFERGNDKHPDKENPLTAAVPAVLGRAAWNIESIDLPATAYYPTLRPEIAAELVEAARKKIPAATAAVAKAETALSQSQATLETLRQTLAANEQGASDTDTDTAATGKAEAEKPAPILHDDFAAKTELWTFGDGDWEYRDGRLIQNKIITDRCTLTSTADHPADFSSTIQVKITGGERWKSVGVSFDANAANNFDTVYISAVDGGSKIQVSHTRAGKTTYPGKAAKSLPIVTGQDYSLRVDVRGPLLNAYVDGKLALVYQLPDARRTGKIVLWTFDATAEFDAAEVTTLAPDVQMAGAPEAQSLTPMEAAEIAFHDAEANLKISRQKLAAAEAELASVESRLAADRAKYLQVQDTKKTDPAALAQTALQREREAKVLAAEATVTTEHLAVERAKRAAVAGDAAQKKKLDAAQKKLAEAEKALQAARELQEKPDGEYTHLGEIFPAQSTGRRLALARWIADRQNPLTARVAVNQLWMRHFGQPLVPTVFDFGLNGKPATHPELLDWLAVELMDNDWSMKHIHRLMLTSRVYRMTSSAMGAAPQNVQTDRDNRYYWRMNSRRVESEIVRDSVLAVTGQLDLTLGGPELDADKGLTTYRRSIYYRHAPEKSMTFLELFDTASTNECYRRNETIVPQQALAMVNSSLTLEQARRLSTELTNAVPKNAAGAFIDRLYERVLCRLPSVEEKQTCKQFLTAQTERLSKPDALSSFAGAESLAVEPSGDASQRARESLVHVLLNHNEFITCR